MPPIRESNPVLSCSQCHQSFHSDCHVPAIELLPSECDAHLWRCNRCTSPSENVSNENSDRHLYGKPLPRVQSPEPVWSDYPVDFESPPLKRHKTTKDQRSGGLSDVQRLASGPQHTMPLPYSLGHQSSYSEQLRPDDIHSVGLPTPNGQSYERDAWRSASVPFTSRQQVDIGSRSALSSQDHYEIAASKMQFTTQTRGQFSAAPSVTRTTSANERSSKNGIDDSKELSTVCNDAYQSSHPEDSPFASPRRMVEESAFVPSRHIDGFHVDHLGRVPQPNDGFHEEPNTPTPHRWILSQLTQNTADGKAFLHKKELSAKSPLHKSSNNELSGLHFTAINASGSIRETQTVYDIDESETESHMDGNLPCLDRKLSLARGSLTVTGNSIDGEEDHTQEPTSLQDSSGNESDNQPRPSPEKNKFERIQCSGCKSQVPYISSRSKDRIQCGTCRTSTFPPRILSLLNPTPSYSVNGRPQVLETPSSAQEVIEIDETDHGKDGCMDGRSTQDPNVSETPRQQERRQSPRLNEKNNAKESYWSSLDGCDDNAQSSRMSNTPPASRKRRLEDISSDPELIPSPNGGAIEREIIDKENIGSRPRKKIKFLDMSIAGQVPNFDILRGELEENQEGWKVLAHQREEALRVQEEELQKARDKILALEAKEAEIETMRLELARLKQEQMRISPSKISEQEHPNLPRLDTSDPASTECEAPQTLDDPSSPQTNEGHQFILSGDDISKSQFPAGFETFIRDPENLDFREKDFLKAFPEFHQDNVWFDRAAKLAEIRARPSRKESFGKRLAFSRASRHGNLHHELQRQAPAPTQNESSSERDPSANRQKSFQEFFGIPEKVIPTTHEKGLAYRDEALTSSGKLRRAKFMHNVGRNPLA
ncbi:hypothetical protein L228DRAFT_266109 [Xylona heveae TC161]|uniref:Zinc finger PHD-type domain-containing protein n=1 Tax=Xylona heveae (strain CBS 132557 / TC161) TaxID=1328760 RepID=A0A165J2R7_XYLHT|nr:hypothetical protein L228DRAFT_266109 [Xylona heveae TC161]KZF25649.1 hypothetical protein L228DRAFT_266109 [Xylona heveae TC161]